MTDTTQPPAETLAEREAIIAAITKADGNFGYSYRLTKMDETGEEHTLLMDGFEPAVFEDRLDGYPVIEQRRNAARTDAILAALTRRAGGDAGVSHTPNAYVLLEPDAEDVRLLAQGVLARCPCCAGTPSTFSRLFPHSGIYQAYVNCSRCHVQVLSNARDRAEAREQAIAAWSKRPVSAGGDAMEGLQSPVADVLNAAWALCDDTENGDSDRPSVPREAWKRLADALDALEAIIPKREQPCWPGVAARLLAASDPAISGLQPVSGHSAGCGVHDDYRCDCPATASAGGDAGAVRQALSQAVAALQPFADADEGDAEDGDHMAVWPTFTVGDLRRAVDAVKEGTAALALPAPVVEGATCKPPLQVAASVERLRKMADCGRIDAGYGDFSHPAATMIDDVRKLLAALSEGRSHG